MTTRFSRWLQDRLAERNLNYSGLASLVGVRPNSARAWAIGQSEPSPRRCQSLAKLFHVQPEDIYRLLGWLPTANRQLPESKRRLINKVLSLPDTDLECCEALVDHYLQRQAREQVRHHISGQDEESSE